MTTTTTRKASVSKAVGNRRLLKLAKFLRKLKPAQFNFNEWVAESKNRLWNRLLRRWMDAQG